MMYNALMMSFDIRSWNLLGGTENLTNKSGYSVCWLRIQLYIRHIQVKCSCFILFRTQLMQCGKWLI